jgi:acetyltransferase-like isoleucine patch superfamily enzyme
MSNPFDHGYFSSIDLREMGFKSVGQDVYIAKNATIIGLSNISLGSRVRIDAYTSLICQEGEIVFGSNIHVGAGSYIGGIGSVKFCDFSGTSQGVRIYSGSDDFSGKSLTNSTIPIHFRKIQQGRVLLQEHALIGSGSIILPNCEIGEATVVGALSLVKENLEPWHIYGGIPAKKISKRSRHLKLAENDYLNFIQEMQ